MVPDEVGRGRRAPSEREPGDGEVRDAAAWDARYGAVDLVWSATPNATLVGQVAGLVPGTALDVASGEGRNAIWLAEQGWAVTGVDHSPVGIERARSIAAARGVEVTWVVADATTWEPPQRYDLVVLCYLQLPGALRTAAYTRAARAVASAGTLLVIAHDRDNLEHGVGGPQNPAVLPTADEVTADLAATGLIVEHAGQLKRPVEGEDGVIRHAIDLLVRATRPGGT